MEKEKRRSCPESPKNTLAVSAIDAILNIGIAVKDLEDKGERLSEKPQDCLAGAKANFQFIQTISNSKSVRAFGDQMQLAGKKFRVRFTKRGMIGILFGGGLSAQYDDVCLTLCGGKDPIRQSAIKISSPSDLDSMSRNKGHGQAVDDLGRFSKKEVAEKVIKAIMPFTKM